MDAIALLEEKAIGAVQFAVRGIVTACIATLLLLSSSEKKDNNVALVELNTLAATNLRAVVADIAIRHDAGVRKRVAELNALLGEYDLSLSLDDGNAMYGQVFPIDIVRAPRGPFVATSSLEQINSAILVAKELRGEVNDIALIGASLRKVLDEARSRIPKDVKSIWLNFSRGPDYAEVTIGWGELGDQQIEVRLNESIASTHHFSFPISLVKEFSELPATKSLVGGDASNLYLFPGTKKMWDQVRNRLVVDAREFIARANVPRERALEVFGLAIPERLVSWSAPLVILGASVHLFIYTRRLAGLIESNPRLLDFPWIYLMSERLIAFISILLLGLLPLCAIIWTIVQTWDSSALAARIVSCLALICAIPALFESLRRLPSIRALSMSKANI